MNSRLCIGVAALAIASTVCLSAQPAAPAPQAPLPAPSGFFGAGPVVIGYDANNQPIYAQPQSAYGGAWAARAAANPYAAPANYARRRTRGEQAAPVKVFYDRSQAGDAAYFEDPCPALLAVDSEGSLTITPGCGEASLVVPASVIVGIRMNVAVAKEVGAFHIETAKGLYLMCTGESGTRDESLRILRSLGQQLNLSD